MPVSDPVRPPTTKKWRPTLSMIVVVMLLSMIALPLAGLFFFRLYENQLIRQTEAELIAQGAVLSAYMAAELAARDSDGLQLGTPLPPELLPDPDEPYHPVVPSLDLAGDEILGPRPEPRQPERPTQPAFAAIGARMYDLTSAAQKTSLAGFRILDPFGTVIAGRHETGTSLAHVAEVASALKGRYASVMRVRVSNQPPPSLYSLSRGTGVRVFVTVPVIHKSRVAGIIYMSRTPSNIVKQLYNERKNLVLALLFVLTLTIIIGFLFLRTISGPLNELIARTSRISRGDRAAMQPLQRHGSREIAKLSESFLAMAESLQDRTDYIANFAAHVSHELKSPLTSIQGAAELLRDSGASMTPEEREKFLDNIVADTKRQTILVERLRDLARADNPQTGGSCTLSGVIDRLRQKFSELEFAVETIGDSSIAVSDENTGIILGHLLENAAQHNARTVRLTAAPDGNDLVVLVSDDGDGITGQDRSRIFDAFFTTRREAGGTGMGLGIVKAMLTAHRGTIHLLPSQTGALFELRFPRPA